ncbi:MAG: RNB domain-containing ribonuclease, partial [Planctomycetota bacterium]
RILKGHTKDIEPEVIKLLKDMDRLSRIIERRRDRNGMLHLDLPETELIMNKAGQVVDAQPADDSYPHTIIEMFMVEANEAVAQLLDNSNAEFMRRIHPEPDSLSMKSLAKIVRLFGYRLSKQPDRMDLQNLLKAVKGKENSLAVNLIVLRSMEKAVYLPLKVGHFALASSYYCHFTSPIRRYADLLVHRVIENYLQEKKPVQDTKPDLIETGKHISFTEQQAQDAENELKAVLILQMLSKRIGEELDCVVTGTAGFGVFVRCKKFGIEGLIVTDNLGADEWKYNQKAMCLEGVNSGVVIRLGMGIRVKIVSVNVAARQLNLTPAEPLIDYKKIEKKKKKQKQRQKTRTQKRNFRRR